MSKPRSRRVILVRTGATEWDNVGRLAGTADLPISPDGRRRLEHLSAALSGVPFGCVWSPGDEASCETAVVVAGFAAERDTGPKPKLKKNDALRELGLGLWEGSLAEELRARCPSAFGRWCEDPRDVTPPQGESIAELGERLVAECVRLMHRSRDESHALVNVLRPIACAALAAVLTRTDLVALHRASGAVGFAAEPALNDDAAAEGSGDGAPAFEAGVIDVTVSTDELEARQIVAQQRVAAAPA